jgi:hypothetical protein
MAADAIVIVCFGSESVGKRSEGLLEARSGIEPLYTALQAAA